jgi:hypothetical protein
MLAGKKGEWTRWLSSPSLRYEGLGKTVAVRLGFGKRRFLAYGT